MRSTAALFALFLLALHHPAFAGTKTVAPTTTLAAETGNNTSSSSTFLTQSNGNIGPANVSKAPSSRLLYPGATTPIYVHFMAWFGGSNHISVGYKSDDPAQVKRQVNDMLSRGIIGAIVDWYGPSTAHARENNTTIYLMQEAQTRNGAFKFAITYDGGALTACHNTPGCNLTNLAISDLTYAYNTFENSVAYLRVSGRPVVFFFSPDRYGTLGWSTIAATVPGNPIFVFRNSGGFTHAASGGSFSWVGLNANDAYDMGLSYFDYFYQTSLSHPQALTVGSGNKGFNDSLASWAPSPPRIQYQQCGQTWLKTNAEAGKFFSSTSQLDAMQFVTWNDYEEGTEIETGIDNCVSLSAGVSGNTLSWTVNGNLNTLDHFTIFISSDGVNLMPLANVAATAKSYDLSAAGMAAGTYQVYVKAVGMPSMTNKMSVAVTYNVGATSSTAPVAALSLTPTSGNSPLAMTASTSGSYDPNGSVSATRIDFGDGSSVSAASGTHTYSTPGSYTVTATVTDNTGLSSSASKSLSVYGVKVTSPAAGSTVASPVHVVAAASSGHAITYMKIYLDYVSVYGIAASSMNTYVNVSSGTHHFTVQAWDSTGAVFKNSMTLTVP